MPLIKGKSQKSFVKNLKTEMHEGKPMKQSLAIAYSMKRKAKGKKYAEGDEVQNMGNAIAAKGVDPEKAKAFKPFAKGGYLQGDEMYPHAKGKMFDVTNKYADGEEVAGPGGVPLDPKKGAAISKSFNDSFGLPKAEADEPPTEKKAKGGFIGKEKASGFVEHEGNTQRPNGPSMAEEAKKFNQHMVDMQASTSQAEQGEVDSMMDKESEDLSQLDRYAMGGELAGHVSNKSYENDDQDIVDRIMYKRHGDMKDFSELDRYSKGGRVANHTGGNDLAGFDDNQFDDLVLRDDLESSYGDDDNAGDSLDNEQENEDRKDIVARIMASRKKKDKLPNPA